MVPGTARRVSTGIQWVSSVVCRERCGPMRACALRSGGPLKGRPMTVALVLTAEPAAGLCGQLTSLGIRRVDATAEAGSGGGLRAIAAAARHTGEPMLICGGDLAVPRQALARLLDTPGTAGYAEGRGGRRALLGGPGA